MIPEQIEGLVGPFFLLLFGLTGVWLALSVIAYFHQRAYNLTKAETARSGSGGVKPDFLAVDREKRADAMARGRAFDEARAAPTPVAKACRWTQFAVIAAALLSFLSAAVGALMKVGEMQSAFNQFSSWERFTTIIGAYKIGFAIAAAVILVSLLQLILSFTRNRAA